MLIWLRDIEAANHSPALLGRLVKGLWDQGSGPGDFHVKPLMEGKLSPGVVPGLGGTREQG